MKLVHCLGGGFGDGWMDEWMTWHIIWMKEWMDNVAYKYGWMNDMTHKNGVNVLVENSICSSWKLVGTLSTCIVEKLDNIPTITT